MERPHEALLYSAIDMRFVIQVGSRILPFLFITARFFVDKFPFFSKWLVEKKLHFDHNNNEQKLKEKLTVKEDRESRKQKPQQLIINK